MRQFSLNLNSLATILFTCDLYAYKEVRLTSDEWHEVERILKIHGLHGPASLFGLSGDDMMDMLNISEFVAYKLSSRIKTISIFLKLLNDLTSKGIRIITKYDEEYPRLLVKNMKKRAPDYLYVIGDMPLNFEGISIQGLQDVAKKDRAYTKRLVDKIIEEDKWFISNDSKGIDSEAFTYAMNHKCKTIAFMCDKDMLDKAHDYRRQIKNGSLVLLSAVDPARRFDITNCLDRNSYVCGLSKYQIIISSKINSGATWFTAMHNMHHNWTKSFVLSNHYPGNMRLLEMKTVPLYVKDVLSDLSFEMIYENNIKTENEEINIDQMSIFEFIGDENEK
ncbi:MAG: DNA-processing protein DprA [Faecalibacillus sp.]